MKNLLVRPEAFQGRIENFGFEYLSFQNRQLKQGQTYSSETGARELAIVVLGGVCSVKSSRYICARFRLRAFQAGRYGNFADSTPA